jgi:uncharacterized protein (TIGR04222 family)
MNPFNYTGLQFLVFYGVLMAGGLVLTIVARLALRGGGEVRSGVELSPEEWGYLAGGPRRAVSTALVALLQDGLIRIHGDGRLTRISPDHRVGATDLERAVQDLAASGNYTASLPRKPVVRRLLDRIDERLVHHGLLVPPERRPLMTAVTIMVMGLVAVTGVTKVLVGLSRQKPVGFLLLALVVWAVATLLVLKATPRRTRGGTELLNRMRAHHRRAAPQYASAHPRRSGDWHVSPDLALPVAVAVMGTGALAGTTYAGHRHHLGCPSGSGSDAWSGWGGGDSGGGVSCGGGGASCGGGGGGGGCGGCGGN